MLGHEVGDVGLEIGVKGGGEGLKVKGGVWMKGGVGVKGGRLEVGGFYLLRAPIATNRSYKICLHRNHIKLLKLTEVFHSRRRGRRNNWCIKKPC